MFDFDMVIDLLRADGSVVVNKSLARNIGLDCAVLYSELASKYKYFKGKDQLTEDGFFFNTVDNLQFDTCLSDFQQRTCIKKLKKLGLVDNRVQGLPAKRYFKIIPDMEILQKYLQTQERQQFLNKSNTRSLKTKEQLLEKTQGNNTNLNNPKINNNKKDKASSQSADGVLIVDNLTAKAKTIYQYFMNKYISCRGEVHPTININVVNRLNEIIEDEGFMDEDLDRNCYLESDGLIDMIDLYFKTNYPLENGGYADHRIWHFLSSGVLKNLYYKGCY